MAELEVAKAIGMGFEAFQRKYLADAQFNAVVRVAARAIEQRERLREALDELVNAWPIPSPQFTAALNKGRTALEGHGG